MYINSKHCHTERYSQLIGAWALIFTEPRTKTEIAIGVYHTQQKLQEVAAWVDRCVSVLSVRDWMNSISDNPLPVRKRMIGFIGGLPKCECQGVQTHEQITHIHFLKTITPLSVSNDV